MSMTNSIANVANTNVVTGNFISALEEANIRGILINCDDEIVDKAIQLIEGGYDIQGVIDASLKFTYHHPGNEEYMRGYLKTLDSLMTNRNN